MMLGLKLVRTIIMLHITIAAAAGLVSGLGGWTLLRKSTCLLVIQARQQPSDSRCNFSF
jgi:hypothetical protein